MKTTIITKPQSISKDNYDDIILSIPKHIYCLIKDNKDVMDNLIRDLHYVFSTRKSIPSSETIQIIYSRIMISHIYKYLYSGETMEEQNYLYQFAIQDSIMEIEIYDKIKLNYLLNRIKTYMKSMLNKTGIHIITSIYIKTPLDEGKIVINI